MESMKELNLREMEEISGGCGGYSYRPPERDMLRIYQIQAGDTLAKIARTFRTTTDFLKSIYS